MVQLDNLNFSTSLGVLFELKNIKGHKTINETYKSLETDDLGNILEIMSIAYNKANKTNYTVDEFTEILDSKNFGFIKIAEGYAKIVEAIMFNGLSPEEVAERKNALTNLKK